MRSALLVYRKLTTELEAFGLKTNPYDLCVMSRTTEAGDQQAVIWHVDDLMSSCRDSFKTMSLTHYLSKIYVVKMTVSRGKKHAYFGMDWDYSCDRMVQFLMMRAIDGAINDFPELIDKSSPTLYGDNLFKVRDAGETTFLLQQQARMFHHCVAQLLFIGTRAKWDIQTAFLTTLVKKYDDD
jgi:hypothetical protein